MHRQGELNMSANPVYWVLFLSLYNDVFLTDYVVIFVYTIIIIWCLMGRYYERKEGENGMVRGAIL
jgi:hypothetical protein